MNKPELSPEFLEFVQQITGKRARIVVDHILEHGYITTEDLESRYGYTHPPRAVRDVREQGVPIETFRVKNEQGRSIAAYRFAPDRIIQSHKISGRRTFPKEFKQQLFDKFDGHCAICHAQLASRYLQIDHRVPYEVVGDVSDLQLEDYLLLCASCNRSKSWSCEHCDNGTTDKDSRVCLSCYWASPQDYQHIATHSQRRLDIVFDGDEIALFEKLSEEARTEDSPLQAWIKHILQIHSSSKDD